MDRKIKNIKEMKKQEKLEAFKKKMFQNNLYVLKFGKTNAQKLKNIQKYIKY